MTWLGQKPVPEPIRPTDPATAVQPKVAPLPTPAVRVEKIETRTVASIGKSLHVRGEVRGSEDLAIEGRVEGTIDLNGYHVTIGETGKVAAEIRAKSVVVGGMVEGDVQAAERVEVAATGTMVGDIRSPRVVLLDGSRFKGSIDMDAKATPRPVVAAPDETLAYASTTKS